MPPRRNAKTAGTRARGADSGAASASKGRAQTTRTKAKPARVSEGQVSESENGSDSESDNDSDGSVDSNPPRPPPRIARGVAAAAAPPEVPRPAPRKSAPLPKAKAKVSPPPAPASAPRPSRAKPASKAKPEPEPTPTRPVRAARPSRASLASNGRGKEPTGLTDSDSDSSDSGDGDDFEQSSDESDASEAFEESDADDASVNSEDIDDEPPSSKRKSAVPTPNYGNAAKYMKKGKGGRKVVVVGSDEEIELEEGQEIVGRIIDAPATGWVPAGQISHNTIEFLHSLLYPDQNNREWFKNHEPWFRRVEKEWRDFVQVLLGKMSEQDTQIPILPARDLCHRIYRDIRFSKDKTPYKAHFGLTVSRSGRRGIWAGYHMYLTPKDSFIACGSWQPETPVLHRVRARLLAPGGCDALRAAISTPEFVDMFGPPKPHPKGKRQSVFGHSDQLKVAPKGVDKAHPDIDILKLKSITVVKHFTIAETTSPDFADIVAHAVGVMAPFVHTLNDYIAPEAQYVDSASDDGE